MTVTFPELELQVCVQKDGSRFWRAPASLRELFHGGKLGVISVSKWIRTRNSRGISTDQTPVLLGPTWRWDGGEQMGFRVLVWPCLKRCKASTAWFSARPKFSLRTFFSLLGLISMLASRWREGGGICPSHRSTSSCTQRLIFFPFSNAARNTLEVLNSSTQFLLLPSLPPRVSLLFLFLFLFLCLSPFSLFSH